jgi:hypothetical protein
MTYSYCSTLCNVLTNTSASSSSGIVRYLSAGTTQSTHYYIRSVILKALTTIYAVLYMLFTSSRCVHCSVLQYVPDQACNAIKKSLYSILSNLACDKTAKQAEQTTRKRDTFVCSLTVSSNIYSVIYYAHCSCDAA